MTQSESLDMITKVQLALQAMEVACKRIDELKAENKVLKEALAQPEQEPVAWADHGVVNWIADKQFKHAALLYESPQRTWVGLTDDDEIPWDGVDAKSFAKAIEAKLKDKNL